jgi:hypothetical protein
LPNLSPIVTPQSQTETTATGDKEGPSESNYSKMRKLNIEKNKILLASLGLGGGGAGILGESLSRKKKK